MKKNHSGETMLICLEFNNGKKEAIRIHKCSQKIAKALYIGDLRMFKDEFVEVIKVRFSDQN